MIFFFFFNRIKDMNFVITNIFFFEFEGFESLKYFFLYIYNYTTFISQIYAVSVMKKNNNNIHKTI